MAASTRETELSSNASPVSDQMARATAELCPARDTISTKSKELSMVAQLKSVINSHEDDMAFYDTSEKELKKKLVVATNESIRPSQLADDIRVEVVALQKQLRIRDGVIRSIIEYSCASLGPSPRRLVNSLSAGLDKSVPEAYSAGSIHFQFHAYTAIDRITLRASKGGASDDGDASSKWNDDVDPPVELEAIQL